MIRRKVCMVIAVFLFAATSTALPDIETHGTLAANDGKHIYDWELDLLTNLYIGDTAGTHYESMVLAFTECYGGDKFDDFFGYDNTALLSGSFPGHQCYYGGYHRALAGALRPGVKSQAAHAAGVAGAAPGDTPMYSGANVTLGGTNSTHVLVWAGAPNWQDQADINDIHGNFAGHPGTTVTVLSGDGTGQHADAAATLHNLVDAFKNIGAQMNAKEQFVLFVTDHGDLDQCDTDYTCYTGWSSTSLDAPAYDHMLADPDNQAQLSLFSDVGLSPSQFDSITVNGYELPSFSDVFFELDYDNDGLTDKWQYIMPVDEAWLLATGNEIAFNNAGDGVVLDVCLESGAIARIPEPTTVVLLLVGGLTVLRRW